MTRARLFPFELSAETVLKGFLGSERCRKGGVTSPAGTFSYTLGAASAASPLAKKLLLPNTSYITNTYDSVARLKGTYLKNSGHTVTNKHEYAYNLGHQRINSTNRIGTYYTNTYDPIGQLKIANSSVNSEDRGYQYDAAWNLSYRTNNGSLYTWLVDGKNQLTKDHESYTNYYDGNGNLTNRYNVMSAAYNYTYDDENQLTSAERETWWRSVYVYDGKGRLRKRQTYTWSGSWTLSTTTLYVYDGMRVIQERNASNVPQVSYTRGTDLSGSLEGAGGIGGLLGRSHAYQTGSGNWTNHNFYHADGNGNVTYMLNSAQSRVAEYVYDPYGNTISTAGTLATANVYRFSSKEVNADSGLYYYGYRFYDPNSQRWLNRDPIEELGFELIRKGGSKAQDNDLNRWRFVANEPIGHTDALGLKLYKCVRQAKTMKNNLHAYLWDGKLSCGRTGAAYATGEDVKGDNGPGTPGHTCVEIPGSDGKEAAVMDCCRRVSFSPFFPGINDCHNWLDRCLGKNGLDDPPLDRFNEEFWKKVAEGVDKGLQ